jgi:hypothetical protein
VRRRDLSYCLALGVLAGCHWLVGLSGDPPRESPVASDAGADTAPAPTPTACDDSTLSPPANAPAGGTLTPIDFVLGYVTVQEKPPPDAGVELCPVNGLDLDHRHTCYDDEGKRNDGRCPDGGLDCSWGASCRSETPSCDGPGGSDNSLAALTQSLSLVVQQPGALLDANVTLRTGAGNMILRLGGYNEQPDDAEVELSVLLSSGLTTTMGQFDDAGGMHTPPTVQWDGRSLREWTVEPNSYRKDFPDAPRWTTHGYVHNHVLVTEANPGEGLPLPIQLGELQTPLKEAKLIAELRQVDGHWEMVRGRIAGRLTASDMLYLAANVQYVTGDGSTRVCDIFGFVASLKTLICPHADLPNEPGGACASMSFGAGFVAVPGVLGTRRPVPQILHGCDPVGDCQ